MPVVGFLNVERRRRCQSLVNALRQGLKEAGFVEGQNIAIEYRWAEDQSDRLPALRPNDYRPVAVIVGNSLRGACRQGRNCNGADRVRQRRRPGQGRPGDKPQPARRQHHRREFFNGELGSKRLELLRQLVPKATTIGVLVNPHSPKTEAERRDVEARRLADRAATRRARCRQRGRYRDRFRDIRARGVGALICGAGAFMFANREQIVALAARYRVAGKLSTVREAVNAGGLMSYGASISDAYRQAGIYAGRVLKGEKPADLPVMQSTKFEFVINLKTAKALGLDVPPTLLALADEVIE